MSLYEKLQKAKSEEDVKKIYIDFLGLKGLNLGRIDIQTDKIWFEAKDKPTSTYVMFTQLLHYVNVAKKLGDPIPPFLCVLDRHKAALMETSKAKEILDDKNITWGTKASQVSPKVLEQVSHYLGTNFVSYNIEYFSDQFKEAVQVAIKEGRIIRTQINPNNLLEVFETWVEKIGKEIVYTSSRRSIEDENYTLLFYADIMSDGKNPIYDNLPAYIIHAKGKPAFNLKGQTLELMSIKGYEEFWSIYEKPPKEEYRKDLLERQDTLIPLNTRKFTGAYYTPLPVVKKAYEELTQILSPNWQTKYVIWDMCCGVGNLEVFHNKPRNVFMSTLDNEHIDIMQASKTCLGSTIFQYDYLNDDINPETGEIDYTLTGKMPKELQDILKEGKKEVLVLINPPYGEAGEGTGVKNKKTGISNTNVGKQMNSFGKAKNELFAQFVARILKEIPKCRLAMFSKLKYVNAPNFVKFRTQFKAQFLGGFIVPSKSFDGISGQFPIGFLVWNLNRKTPFGAINVKILDKKTHEIGEKTFIPHKEEEFLNNWVKRPKANQEQVLPLKNAISPATAKNILSNGSNNMLGYLCSRSNDMQQANSSTILFSSVYGDGHGMYINAENLAKASMIFTVRRIVKHIWYKDRDQFLIPHTEPSHEFANDCLIWMLFNGSNLTASADNLEYDNKQWSIVNHFIPYTEQQVNASGRFESDFMVRYLDKQKLSKEARAVYNQGLLLWKRYFELSFNHKMRDELKLNRPDVGWYQIRKALESNVETLTNFQPFKDSYADLTDKILSQVYDYGFLIL